MKLSTDFWVSALIRRVEQGGGFAYVTRKGDARAGSVILKIINSRTREVMILREAISGDETGDSVWMRPIKAEDEATLDAYIERQKRIDSDLWVIEIEDAEGKTFLTENVDLS
jgi:hypothetical protein